MENFSSPNELGAPTTKSNPKHRVHNVKKITFFAIGFLLLFYFFFLLFLSAPANFPVGTIFKIEQGNTLRGVSLQLKREHIIRSRLFFEAFVILFGREKGVVSADYFLESKLPVFEVARRIAKGERHVAPVVVTIPEGFDINQISDAFASKLANFDKDDFLVDAKGLEGYLFPDTYFFLTTDTEREVIKSMNANFEKKISPLRSAISFSKKTEKEIIIMASLIEGEAKGETDRGVISGILWKRISINMPLQVDASPNTYKTKGLPKSPINNPGIEAIKAAIYPKNSPYLYYLHDKNGVIHYAKNFSEHLQNVQKYLK